MRKTYQYRLFPNHSQKHLLSQTLEECRWVYNQTLALKKDAWETDKKYISLYDTHDMLPVWKKQRPSINQVYSQVLQNVCVRVDVAFKAFFRRVKAHENPGYPRFKGVGQYDSFTYPQYPYSGFRIKGKKLHLSRAGDIKIELHRPIEGKIKTLTIRQSSTNKWFACFSCEYEENHLSENIDQIGIDVGLTSFATLSNGEKIDNPRFFRRDEKDLGKSKIKRDIPVRDSCGGKHRNEIVNHIYERISNRRKDFAHQWSRKLVNRFGVICVEDLEVNKMVHNHCLAKSILDASWSQFFTYLSYKAEWAGRKVVAVNPAYTSQTCSSCGHRQKLTLATKEYICPCCGLVIDRDQNAALNILALGLQCIGIQSVEAHDLQSWE